MPELEVLEPTTNGAKFLEDPLFSAIVPIYKIPPMVLKRCLLSLQTQDYDNIEVILVFDGDDSFLENTAEPFLNQQKSWRKIVIPHGGACAARNAGFKESTGEIVSFFNSDYIAKPGMIRMWVDKLQDNPDCGFVYGGYEWNSARRSYYPSKPFSEFELNVANFIDCGFPLWRKYVVEWDVHCKSLQDWDFWIRVVKTHQIKGLYLGRDYSFIAEPARPNGLTYDSSENWLDRVGYVKSKNGIEKHDLLVTSLGAKNHGVEIAKMLGADFRDDTIDKPSDYKALYMIGFYIKPNEQGLNEHARILSIFKEKYPNCKRIVHFVGADIYWLRKFPYDALRYLAGALKGSCDVILSENQAAHDELLSMGLPTQIVPIPSYSEWEIKPLPKNFTVSLFLTGKSDFDKYLKEHTLSIVRAMPDIQFTGYGDEGIEVTYPNIKYKGAIPRNKWPDYVYQNSALLRICRHDTLPMANCEFLMAGRNVITNIPMKGADVIDTSGTLDLNEWDIFSEGFSPHNWPATKKKIVQKIREIKKRTDNSERISISDSYKKILDKQTYIQKIKEFSS